MVRTTLEPPRESETTHTTPRETKQPAVVAPQTTSQQPTGLELTVPPRSFAMALATVAALLTALHVAFMLWHYEFEPVPWLLRSLFDLDEEQSFGTWFSSAVLALAGISCWLVARRARAAGEPWRAHWLLLGAGFILLSADEIAGIHESVNTALGDMSWAVPGGILAAVVGLAFAPFLWRLRRRTAVLFAVAGAIYLGGAVGVELATEPYAQDDLLDTLEYNLTTALEELMEMGGIVLFVYAALDYLAHQRADTDTAGFSLSLSFCSQPRR